MNDSYNGAFWSQAAHNFLRAGILRSAGVPATLYFGPPPIPADAFYVHHPTLLPLAVTGAFAIFGESEWAARLVPIACSLASAALLWQLVKSCAGMRAAAFSIAAFVTMPMELHYGEMVNFEPLQLLWILLALVALRRWQTSGETRWRALMLAAFMLAVWTDWLGSLFASLVACFLFFQKENRAANRRAAWTLALIVAAGLALFLAQIRLANPQAWSDLAGALRGRLGAGDLRGGAFTVGEWARTVGGYLGTFFLPFHWLLAAAGAVIFWRRKSRDSRWLGVAALGVFLMNAIYVVALRNQSYIHDFASFYLTLPLAIACGVALDAAARWCSDFQNRTARLASFAAICMLLIATAAQAYQRSAHVDSQFLILDESAHEPRDLMPVLGKLIASSFPPDEPVICNFDAYSSPLAYYAQRPLITGIISADDWRALAGENPHAGGVIWADAEGAAKLREALPAGEQIAVQVCGIQFVFWKAKSPAHPRDPGMAKM